MTGALLEPMSGLSAQLRVDVLEPWADATAVDDLVLLHGWGTDSRIWW